jgi:hypothetical protein
VSANLFATPQRVALWVAVLFLGAFAGLGAVAFGGGNDVDTSVCGRPTVLHVRYAWPGTTPRSYSDDDVNNEDCFER